MQNVICFKDRAGLCLLLQGRICLVLISVVCRYSWHFPPLYNHAQRIYMAPPKWCMSEWTRPEFSCNSHSCENHQSHMRTNTSFSWGYSLYLIYIICRVWVSFHASVYVCTCMYACRSVSHCISHSGVTPVCFRYCFYISLISKSPLN